MVKDEANDVSRDHSMEGLISRGKEVGLYPENKGKSLQVILERRIDLIREMQYKTTMRDHHTPV